MIIHLTVDQYEALDHDLFSEDDWLREFPIPLVGDLAEVLDEKDNVVGYALAHPALTYEDEIVLHTMLDSRAARLKVIKDAPKGRQKALERQLLKELRGDRGKSARALSRVADRKRAREEMRAEIRKDPTVALRVAARRQELAVELG